MPYFGASSRRPDHPYLVNELADLPAGLRGLAEPLIAPGETIDMIFVVPPHILSKKFEGLGGARTVPLQALLFTPDGVVYVQLTDPAKKTGCATAFKREDMLYAHLSVILLYGRLELCGVADGVLKTIILEYNSVSQPMLQPGFLRFLHSVWDHSNQASSRDENSTLILKKIHELSLKYRNGLEDFGLQASERLLEFVYQPPITRRYLWLFHRKIAPPALLALTQNQLIIIEEGITSATSYGWLVSFFPLERIRYTDVRPKEQCQEIVFCLASGTVTVERQVTVENEAAEGWKRLWADRVR